MNSPYTITLLPIGEVLPCELRETVLSAILRSGARVFFGCTGGGCGVCQMRLISGHLDYGRYSAAALSEDERRKGFFLSCQAMPVSDLTIQLTEANKYRKVATFFYLPPTLRWPGRETHERDASTSDQAADDRR